MFEHNSALMAHELSRLNIDITALSEICIFSKKVFRLHPLPASARVEKYSEKYQINMVLEAAVTVIYSYWSSRRNTLELLFSIERELQS
ncbi:unnamed protein product [Brugia pahangi]|uniref:Uncharacterized protein n=1 Tax=Brugia pahangi TaxID=6280 RepID=A0A0N4TUX8_BRUPA|nr:unnamed protein product [Brugia pahangi]